MKTKKEFKKCLKNELKILKKKYGKTDMETMLSTGTDEAVNTIELEREKFHLIQKKHIKYYFELKDLSLTLLDNSDQILSRLESSINLFFSVQGHRMNMVMKTLTVISSIFIPLTFIAGVYGMNFVNIPELNLHWGYFAVWGVMLTIFVLMLFYFKKKKWF